MSAPDGGPARRRPVDPEVELEADVLQLREQHTALATDVSEMGARLGGEITQLGTQVGDLGGTVKGLADRIESLLGDTAADPATVDWWTLNHEQAETAWSELWSWLETYLVPSYGLTREEIPDCWTRHHGMRDELSWLWCAHRAAYAPQAAVGTAAQWHLTYRTGALRTVRDLAERFGCAPGRCQGEAHQETMPSESEPTGPDRWLTDGIAADLNTRQAPDQENS